MNQSKLFILVLLLLLFIVSCSKVLLIPVTLIISGFFVVKRQYNLALIVLSLLFFISLIFNNKIEMFNAKNSSQENFQADQTSPDKQKKYRLSVDEDELEIENSISNTSVDELNPTSTSNSKKIKQSIQEKRFIFPDEEEDKQISPSSSSVLSSTKPTIHSAQKLKPTKPSIKPHVMFEQDYNKLFFVFNSLLDKKYIKKNKNSIEEIIDNYRINNIFDLSKTVLNKEKNPRYNNFLEKITCRNKGTVDYIQCDNPNYKKIYAFCELIYVFTFNLDTVIELINKYKIMSLCELSAKRSVLQSETSQTSFGYETLGLEFYLNERSFSRKYFDILQILELDKLLADDENEVGLSLEERLYNYHNSDKGAVKVLNTIMVLFDYYSIFDKYILNMEDDEYNWNLGILKSVDLNLACWDAVSYFKDYDVKGRIIKSINKLTSVDDEFLNRGRNPQNPYDPENQSKIDSNSKNYVGSMRNMLNSNSVEDGYVEEEDFFSNNLNTFKRRYKTVYDKNENEKEAIRNKLDKKLNLKYLRDNFNKTMIDITNDMLKLYNRRCDLDCYDDKNPVFSKMAFYTRESLMILTKGNRMMFVGVLLIILSVIFYFIGASR